MIFQSGTIPRMQASPAPIGSLGRTIVIVGVGLIGGSIARAVRQRQLFERIIGVGRNPERLASAVRQGLIDQAESDLATAVREADLVVVCTPVERIVEDVLSLYACLPETGVVTDAGSTKARICQGIAEQLGEENRFCGAHPLAGSEKSGFEHASANLFEGATVVLTPHAETAPWVTERVTTFWRALGGQLTVMDAVEHDLVLAMTSHLPHLVSSALAASVSERDLPLAASGFGDTTRIAAGDPALWTAIFMENAEGTLKAAEEFQQRFETLLNALRDRQPERLQSLLTAAKRHRDLWRQEKPT